jgi:hypothetical protein
MKRFTIYENAAPIGEGVQFRTRVVVVSARGEMPDPYVTLGEMLDEHPTWAIAWVDA